MEVVRCGALLSKSANGRRQRCSERGTKIRHIYLRMAVVCCERHSNQDHVDFAEDGLVDLVELPAQFRAAARTHLNKQVAEIDRELSELGRRRDMLVEELEILARFDAPREEQGHASRT